MSTEEKISKTEVGSIVKTTENVFGKEEKGFYDNSDEESISVDGYESDFEWTKAEEAVVRKKLDLKLMSFALAMTFVLNMDRTNICKYSQLLEND
jgi:hypothetical protein